MESRGNPEKDSFLMDVIWLLKIVLKQFQSKLQFVNQNTTFIFRESTLISLFSYVQIR